MRITRKLTLPGTRQYQSSTWEIELTPADLTDDQRKLPLQEQLQLLTIHSQARVLASFVAEGLMSNDELTAALSPFLGTPAFLNELEKLTNAPKD